MLEGAINDTEVSSKFLRQIDYETVRLQQMTDDLNQLSVIESDALALSRNATEIEVLIRQTVERLRAQADRKGIVIMVYAEPGIPRPVIDRSRVESVLMNMAHNAIKYTEQGGQISIQAQKTDDAVLISVTDTGIGIPSDELPRVFERFYKVDKARNTEGSGLGLAISKHIIAAHGGKIWAESIEGKGSTFFFTLPLPSSNETEIF